MTARLKEIWKKCFGDPQSYIDFFFEHRFRPANTYVYTADGGCKPINYVYAVATLPEYQKRGISRKLLAAVNDELTQQGLTTFLNPASESLFQFYERQGYRPCFYIKEYKAALEDLAAIELYKQELTPIEFREYKSRRDSFFEKEGYLLWDNHAIQYALAENEHIGGKALKLAHENGEGLILYMVWQNELIIRETTLDGPLLKSVIKKLMAESGAETVVARLHTDSEITGKIKPYAMIYGNAIDTKKGYANLMLD